MKSFALAAAALLLATAAQAQTPPSPPAPPDRGPAAVAPGGQSPQEARRHVERDRDRDRPHHRPGGGDRPGGERAGHFRFERGDLEIDVRCPGDEPLKACVDATMQLIDKFSTVR
jgi:hypothetical protein